MKRKFWALILSLVCVFLLSFCLTACDGDTGDDDDKGGVTVAGTYYYCEDGLLDDAMYITFDNGTWTDDENQTGSFTLSDAEITLFVTMGGEKVEFASGTVSGDDISLNIGGTTWLYRKGEDINSQVKPKTLSYELSQDKSYYIVKGIGGLTGDVTVPDEYKKKPVTEIAENAFANCNDLTSIEIGANVTTVGSKAFYRCGNLTSVTLGEKVETIEESTFEECRRLETVIISASVKSVGKRAFYGCLALKDVHYTGTVSDWAQIDFYYHVGNNSVEISNPLADNVVYIVGNSTAMAEHKSRNFYVDGELLTDAEIVNAPKVSPFAFYGYLFLKSVAVGEPVAEIGEYAFYKCGELATLQFSGSSLTEIGESAFSSCSKLKSAVLPASVKKIGDQAFASCYELTTVDVGNGAIYIAHGAFTGCEKLASLKLGSSVAEICEAAFYNCEALTSVTIPSSVIFIGKEAFWGTSLANATFENKNNWVVNKDVSLDSDALDNPSNAAKLLTKSVLQQGYGDTNWEKQTLKYKLSADRTYYIVENSGTTCRSEMVIPREYNGKPVRELATNAFYNCTALTKITLPDTITKIGMSAFSGCTALTGITIPDGVTHIEENAFAGCVGITTVTIPSSVTYIGYSAFYSCSLTSVYYLGDLAGWCGIHGLNNTMYGKPDATLYIDGKELVGDVVIPDGVTAIPSYAFYGCDGITSITIPTSVKELGQMVIEYKNNLQSIYYLGDLAGWIDLILSRSSLNEIMILKNKAAIYVDGKELAGDVVIPDGVTTIPSYAFYNCSGITSITIPSSVTEIRGSAFSGCTSLTSITYDGTKEQWNNLPKQYDWDSKTGDYTVFCTDGEIPKDKE